MKKIIYILIILFVSLSCESWLDVNKNPNAPGDVSYEELLPAGISSVAYVVGGRYQVLGALWSQHWTQSPGASQYAGIDSYDINSSTYDQNQFSELYAGALKNLELVRVQSLANEEYNYYLIATVVQSYAYQVLADLYDQIPFSEALKGDQGLTEPMYELGPSIYDSLITRIDFALSLDLNKEGLKNPEERDLVFNGEITRWIEFANTLKLRIFLRQSEVNHSKVQQAVQDLYNAGAAFLETDAALDIYTDASGRRNPLFDTDFFTLGRNPNLILSHTLYSFMIENADFDRLSNLFNTPEAGGEHKALIQGNYYAPEESPGTNSSSYSKPIMDPTAPVYLMSLAESNLLQAEAIMRYRAEDFNQAKELYDGAIASAFLRVIKPSGSFGTAEILNLASTFYGGVYAFPSEGGKLDDFIKSIAYQKWLALSGIQNLELFFELNRTGYPVKSSVPGDDPNYVPGELTLSVNNVTSGRFPRRLIFPESEYANNRNTPEKQPVWQKVWWDVSEN